MRLLVAGTGHMIDISIGSTIVLLFAESSLLRQQALEIYLYCTISTVAGPGVTRDTVCC